MDADQMPQELIVRTARCGACGRPVWPAPTTVDREQPAPYFCDYCARVGQ
jgi:hypothetical protein